MTDRATDRFLAEGERRARRALLRAMIVWSPVFVLFAALTGYNFVRLAEGDTGVGGGLTGALTALISILVGHSSIQAIRDLFADPVETRGAIGRTWTKVELLLRRRHYIAVGPDVFHVPKQIFAALPDPPAWISVLHYPHTLAVIAWRELDVSEQPIAASDADWDEPHPVGDSVAGSSPTLAPEPPPEGVPPAWPSPGEPPPISPYSAAGPGSDPP